jgi:hypothetical protein
VSTIEEPRERKSSGSGLEIAITAVGDLYADYATPLYLQKLARTSQTSGGCSVSIVRQQTQVTEFVCLFV